MTRQILTTLEIQRIAALIRGRRRERQLSLRDLEQLSGVSRSMINRIETADQPRPRPETLQALADALDLPLGDLLLTSKWLKTAELPTLQPYLRAKYGLSDPDAAELERYLHQLRDRHGGRSPGPLDREDEH